MVGISPSFSGVWKQVWKSYLCKPWELTRTVPAHAKPLGIFKNHTWSTDALGDQPWPFPVPTLTDKPSSFYFAAEETVFPRPFLFLSACLFFFSVLGWNSQQIQKTHHSQQQPGFSSGYQLSPTHPCIPAKWWDCDVLKICKIHELWLQISMCNSGLIVSLCHHNGNSATVVVFTLP